MSTERITSRVCGSLRNCPVSEISPRGLCGRRGKLIHTTVRAAQDIPREFEKGVGVTGIAIALALGTIVGHRRSANRLDPGGRTSGGHATLLRLHGVGKDVEHKLR